MIAMKLPTSVNIYMFFLLEFCFKSLCETALSVNAVLLDSTSISYGYVL